MSFRLDPRLVADTLWVLDWPLCQLRLMNDARYPWVILVPRRAGLREQHALSRSDSQQLLAESRRLGTVLMQQFSGDKLNVAALGNLVPQLHIHHIVRYVGDDAWPAPVWGRHPARRYPPALARDRVRALQQALAGPVPLA